MDLKDYLLVGSYLLGATSWAFLFREIKSLKGEVLRLRVELAYERGKAEGTNVESRLLTLEKFLQMPR
jgi:hypothetical protein